MASSTSDVDADMTVYLTQHRDGWSVSVDLERGGELGRYHECRPAVLAARAEALARRAYLLVQTRRGRLQFIEPAHVTTAIIAGELPP
jgi:hypothetical protein